MTIFERIESLRKSKGISQGKLEKELGFSNGSISKWKTSTPSSERLQKLADYFGVTVEYLLTGEAPLVRTYQSTLAAHLEGEDFTEDEMNDIINYIEFVKSRKNKK